MHIHQRIGVVEHNHIVDRFGGFPRLVRTTPSWVNPSEPRRTDDFVYSVGPLTGRYLARADVRDEQRSVGQPTRAHCRCQLTGVIAVRPKRITPG